MREIFHLLNDQVGRCLQLWLFFLVGTTFIRFEMFFCFSAVWYEFTSFFFWGGKVSKKKRLFYKKPKDLTGWPLFSSLFSITLAFPEVARSLREKPLFSRLHWDLVPQIRWGRGRSVLFLDRGKPWGLGVKMNDKRSRKWMDRTEFTWHAKSERNETIYIL